MTGGAMAVASVHGTVYNVGMEYARRRRDRGAAEQWDAERLQALRRHLGYTQRQLADEMGMRQQTVSEWETGAYQPRGASARLLSLIAERTGFGYEAGPPRSSGDEHADDAG